LGGSSAPVLPDAGPLRPVIQTAQVQAARNDTTLFLHVQWESDSQAPMLSVALSGRTPNRGILGFTTAGCFVGCHDSSEGMPNWLPEDGPRSMFLFPGFGGPGDVWLWSAQPGEPEGQVVASTLGTQGLASVPDGGALAGTGSLTDQTWDVVFQRPLAGLRLGAIYDLAVALHPDGVSGRDHYVSLPIALGLDAEPALPATPFAGATPDFTDTATFPALPVRLFLPGITSYEFLVGAVVERSGQLRRGDYRHGGAHAVATGQLGCADCHQVQSDMMAPAVQNAGSLGRLVLRRGGVFGPPNIGGTP
jgi:hypothetical protein